MPMSNETAVFLIRKFNCNWCGIVVKGFDQILGQYSMQRK